jgi:hypothetical protein
MTKKKMEKGEFLLSLNEVYESNIDFLILNIIKSIL